jgi:hypothetical protein
MPTCSEMSSNRQEWGKKRFFKKDYNWIGYEASGKQSQSSGRLQTEDK